IPDKTARHNNLAEITAAAPADAVANTEHLFNRSISYHYLPASVYEHRTNAGEAMYIAHMVLTLIKQNCKESIGIVAFSQEQQNEIEDALETLAEQWKMATQLEEAYQRTEDEQFVGLFVKNLENVQGDERDIIIMSVCYGYDSNKKMLMNFGPINRKGGEKRLNVIFSRAKKHMAVVASIKHTDIKNESNEGANYFRRFLQYAYLVSTGQHADATGILHTLANKQQTAKTDTGIVVTQIAQALNAQGYLTDTYLGQSYFKCQLGVRKHKSDTQYTLGILVDEDGDSNNVLEKYFQRPLTMQAFGWNIVQVWVKDWYHKKDEVLAGLLQQLKA
ncbi:MAG TPA: AAA domain-containing protein, partial [Chitinophagales bacterium]|nr:AAA domain-containing protein [Chitinophagales bacterium]